MARRTIADRIRWLEQNWVVKDGARWSLRGREWVRDQIIRPLYGWRISSRGDGELCDRCAKFAGRVVEWSPELEDTIERDHAAGHDGAPACPGLRLVKIQVVVLCVNRRGGKTTNALAIAGELVAHDEYQDVMMFAAAGQQTEALFRDNLVDPFRRIEVDGGEVDDFEITANAIRFEEHHSKIVIVDSSKRSVTGRGENMLIVEEARDVDGALFVKALPSILDRNYLMCGNKHRFPFSVDDAERPRKRCPTCTARLEPHYARVLIVSSAGVLDDSPDLAWFSELVTMLEREPVPSFHLFRDDDVANPAIAQEARGVLEVFERVPAISEMVRAERTNEFARKGDSFLTDAEIRRCIDPTIRHADGYLGRCIAFLDTALTTELISLVVAVPDDGVAPYWQRPREAPALPPWSLLTIASIWTWEPKKLRGGIADDGVMWEELEPILPLFPALAELWVDVRIQPWAHRLVERAHRSKTLHGRALKRYQHGSKEKEVRRSGFKLLHQRITGKTIRLFGPADDPRIKRLIREMEGLKRKIDADGDWDVIDRNRKVMHADIASGIAALCERAFTLRIARPTLSDVQRTSPELRKVFARDRRFGGLNPDSF